MTNPDSEKPHLTRAYGLKLERRIVELEDELTEALRQRDEAVKALKKCAALGGEDTGGFYLDLNEDAEAAIKTARNALVRIGAHTDSV